MKHENITGIIRKNCSFCKKQLSNSRVTYNLVIKKGMHEKKGIHPSIRIAYCSALRRYKASSFYNNDLLVACNISEIKSVRSN